MPNVADPLQALESGEIGPLYWICGKERFLVDRAVNRLRERALEPRTRDFNYELLYGKEAGAARILSAARTLPMMARRRLVLVRDADSLDAKALEPLIPYVTDPAPETCLAFVGEATDQKAKKFFTAFNKRGQVLKLEPLKERQLAAFVRDEAKARRVKLEAGVAELVAEEVGADLGQLASAMERLELYVRGAGAAGDPKEARVIRVEDVEAVVATTRQRSVFELVDAIGEGSTERAMVALGSLLAAREPGLRILALVLRAVRQLLIAREVLDRGGSRGDVAGALGLPPFLAEKIEAQARRHARGGGTLRAMHELVYGADRTLKSSRVDEERVMEQLVIELSRLGATPPARHAS